MSGERITRDHPMLVAISLEHQRDHDDGPALPREGCNGCRLIEFAWQQYEAAQSAREVAEALESVKHITEFFAAMKRPDAKQDLVRIEAALARFWATVER
jgi:hypothetical protein